MGPEALQSSMVQAGHWAQQHWDHVTGQTPGPLHASVSLSLKMGTMIIHCFGEVLTWVRGTCLVGLLERSPGDCLLRHFKVRVAAIWSIAC